jgi:hypothetical protein
MPINSVQQPIVGDSLLSARNARSEVLSLEDQILRMNEAGAVPPRAPEHSTETRTDARTEGRSRRRRRPKGRQLFCPLHPEVQIGGNGQKYFLHLLQPEELKQRGLSDKRARLVLQAHPVLVLSNEWLEQLFCAQCGSSRWCHVVRHDHVRHTVRWAPRELWQQVAHVDPMVPNPSVSQFSRQAARRAAIKRTDGKRYFEPQ